MLRGAARPMTQQDPPSDDEIAACRRGDRPAIERLLRRELPAIERLCTRLLGPDADVDDAVQLTAMRAIAAFPRFRNEAPVRLWLQRIATHVVIDLLRQPRRRAVSLQVVEDSAPAREVASDRVLGARARLARTFEHLEQLSARNRTAFVLHVLEERPVEEVAALMGASRVTTRSRVFLARRALIAAAKRDPMLREMFEEGDGR